MAKWYYGSDGRQQGPVTREALEDLLRRRTILPSSLIWSEGMQDWQPASSILPLQALPPSTPDETAPCNPYAAPASWAAPVIVSHGALHFPAVKRANYALAMLLNAGGLIGILLGITVTEFGNDPLGTLMIASGFLALLGGTILFLIYLHRAWYVLQAFHPRTTPGKAVGFLFIPIFNLYWTFVAYWRWSQDWNRIVGNVMPNAPRMTEGLFFTYAVLQCVGIIAGALAFLPAFVIFLILLRGVCNAVNFAAQHSNEAK